MDWLILYTLKMKSAAYPRCVIKRQIDIGQTIEFDDVEIPESEALSAWQETIKGE